LKEGDFCTESCPSKMIYVKFGIVD
jgi:hypothetical protein